MLVLSTNKKWAAINLIAGLTCLILGFQNCSGSFYPVSLDIKTKVRFRNSESNSPNSKYPIRIMPLGDSLTLGVGSASCTGPGGCVGYRYWLYSILQEEGIKFDFVGSQTDGVQSLHDRNHEGHMDWRIDEIANSVSPWLIQYNPHVILLHIGTSDIMQSYDLANAEQRLSDLVDLILTVSPDSYVFLAYIVPIAGKDTEVQSFNTSVDNVIAYNQLQNRKVFGAKMYPHFDRNFDYADNVHLNDDGYNKMAEIWNTSFYINGLPSPSN